MHDKTVNDTLVTIKSLAPRLRKIVVEEDEVIFFYGDTGEEAFCKWEYPPGSDTRKAFDLAEERLPSGEYY